MINNYLDAKYAKLLQCYEKLLKDDRFINSQAVKARFLGSDATSKTLKDLIQHHDHIMGEVLKPGTLKNYGATDKYNHGLRKLFLTKFYGEYVYFN